MTTQKATAPEASPAGAIPIRARIPTGPAHFSVVDLVGGEVGRLVTLVVLPGENSVVPQRDQRVIDLLLDPRLQ